MALEFLSERSAKMLAHTFEPGEHGQIYKYDDEAEWYDPAGLVEVVEVVDTFLVRVRAVDTITDAESGDMYAPGHEFTACRHGDLLTFVPCLHLDGE